MDSIKKNKLYWFALYTKPRWEKKVDQKLTLKNIESWCPMQKVERQWSDRKKIIDDPIFKSYVFVHTTLQEKLKILETEGVLNFVHHEGKPAIIHEKEIEIIKAYLLEKNVLITTQSLQTFEADMKVKIRQGVFMDNTGRVLRTTKNKAFVSLESLGQVMIVEFPQHYLKKI
ncbi:MAG: UpxY family transcription antiterminator [Bacteroidetes bacterium]|nr:UpxY family transcription antiterminator [Bacteroidota bacterium]